MKKHLFTLILVSSILFANAQLNVKVTAKSVEVINSSNCDVMGDSDFLFEFNATDNSTFNYSNNSPSTGVLGQVNYASILENSGPFSFSSPNAVYTPTNGVFFNRSYNCVSDFPSNIVINALAYENDDVSTPATSSSYVNGLTATQTTTITLNPISSPTIQTTTFTLTSSDAGCTQTYVLTLEIEYSFGANTPMYISAIEGTKICPSTSNGSTETTIIGGIAPLLYDWSNDGLGDYDDGDAAIGLTAGVYTLQVKDAQNCVVTATVMVETENAPTAFTGFLTSTQTLCAGTSSVAYSVASQTNVTYNWNYSGTGANILGNTNAVEIDFNSVATSGTLSIFSQNSCSVSLTQTLAIQVNAIPTLTINGNYQVCDNASEIFTALGASSYTWSNGSNTSTTVITPTATTVYTLNATQNGCIGTKIFTISTLTSPTVAISPTSSSVCVNQTVTLTANGNGNLFIWSDGVINQSNTIQAQTTTIYTVTSTYNSCFARATYTLYVNPTPDLTITGNTQACIGSAVTLTVAGADSYLWSTNDNTDNIVYNLTGNATLSVTGTNSLTTCAVTKTIAVTNYTTATIAVVGNTVACPGSVLSFTASGFNFYLWSNGDTADNTELVANTTQTISVRGTNTNGCMDSTVVNIVVSTQPSITISGKDTICEGQSAGLIGTIVDATSYTWSTGEITSSINVSPSVTTVYSIDAYSGPCSATESHTVVVKINPVLNFPPIRSFCETDPAFELAATPTGGSFMGTGVSGSDFNPGVGIGNYQVDYTYTAPNGCSALVSQTVTIEACVGIQEFNSENTISLYPNPTQSDFNIKSDLNINTVSIFDYTGKLVKEIVVYNTNQANINIAELNSGFYSVIVALDNKTVKTIKLLKN